MTQTADYRIERTAGAATVVMVGDWTAAGLGRTADRFEGAASELAGAGFDLSGLGAFDMAGALVLSRAHVLQGANGLGVRPDVQRLIEFVAPSVSAVDAPRRKARGLLTVFLDRVGRVVFHMGGEVKHTFIFYGRLLVTLGNLMAHPNRIRVAPTVSLMERAGLDALPIIFATNFFVGATLGFLGEDLLQQFGAQIYTVELVGIGMLRVFAVLITAVILAGRSASSFAAEIGAMKMNQEIDAMQVMGVDPFEALVLPRFVAMFTMTPLLTFVAMMAGLLGGMLVIWGVIGLSPAFFIQRMLENVSIQQFWIGISQAPVMALVIAAIGCRQGLEVGGDVEQLGRRVTTAVVQALFAIIIIDAAFALLFMELGQ
jgi:phospholipid/cholesterol/gamma-HCH transport system permease protein